MRRIMPNSRGIIETCKPDGRSYGRIVQYEQPNNSLQRLDRLKNGESPSLCLSRTRGGAGDLLMITPTLRYISNKYKCKVDFAVDTLYLDNVLSKILEYNPYVNNIIDYNKIERENYDALLDLTCPCIAHEQPGAPPINRIDLFSKFLGITLEDHTLDYFLQEKEIEWARDFLYKHRIYNNRILLVHVNSSTLTRDVPAQMLYDAVKDILGKLRDVRALIITHPETDNNKARTWNLSNSIILKNKDIRQLAALMHFSNLVLCPDSSILHLASALHKKTLTIFGPTDPRARINYHPEAVAIWPGKDLPGYPLWFQPDRNGYICWKRLDGQLMSNSAINMLEGKPLPEGRDFVSFGPIQISNKLFQDL